MTDETFCVRCVRDRDLLDGETWLNDTQDGLICPHCFTADDRAFVDGAVERGE